MQHSNKHTFNIRLKKQMKYLDQTLDHCNMYNIAIYFYNIHMKHLQNTYKTSETNETYSCNMRFQRNISLLLEGRMKARWCVVFTRGSSPTALVGGGSR
jgi:hypothetical protein